MGAGGAGGARGAGGGGGGGSAGARGAVLLVVAAVLGIVLLQAFDVDSDGGSGLVVAGTTTVPAGSSSGGSVPPGPAATTPTTQPGRAPADVTVLVANGTGIRGLGGTTAQALQALGYKTLTAVDATKALDASSVQYAEGYQNEARAIALTLGLPATAVQPLNSPAVPDTQGANVIVLLGADAARNTTTTTTVG